MLNVHITFALAIFTFLLTMVILFLFLKNPGNLVLKIPDPEIEILKHACLLHDIGKICIPDGILNKKSHLSDHERVYGQGYPKGLRREEIPILARILAVADTYDAICSERPYRRAKTREQAVRELKKVRGTQLDEQIVDVFVSLVEA